MGWFGMGWFDALDSFDVFEYGESLFECGESFVIVELGIGPICSFRLRTRCEYCAAISTVFHKID
jgi:hypothetical protein